MEQSEYTELVSRAKKGDRQAISDLVQQYEQDVRLVARINLGSALKPHLDSMDLLQSVHRSLMIGLENAKFDISTPRALVALATTMVRRKIARKWRKLRREQRMASGSESGQLSEVMVAIAARDDHAEDQVAVQEQLKKLLDRLNPIEQKLVTLRFEGFSTADAARMLNEDPDVLRVKLSRLRKRIEDIGLLSDWL